MDLKLLEKQIIRFLKKDELPLLEILLTYGIHLSITYQLSSRALGFVYTSRKGNYHLIVNGNINIHTQKKVFLHEITHIINDLPKIGYIIGFDMTHTPLEEQADKIAESILNYI